MFLGKKFFFSALAVIVLIALLILRERPISKENEASTELTLYCAAAVKKPILKVIESYQKRCSVKINIEYGGSGSLLSRLSISPIGDLFIAADGSYTDLADQKGLILEQIPLATMTPVIAVAENNPKNIYNSLDLARDPIRVSLGNPSVSSIGKQTKYYFEKAGLWARIDQNVLKNGVYKPTVPEVGNDLLLGAVDAVVVWDAIAAQLNDIEIIRPIEFADANQEVTVGVLKSSKNPSQALELARFLKSKTGKEIFEENGYRSLLANDSNSIDSRLSASLEFTAPSTHKN